VGTSNFEDAREPGMQTSPRESRLDEVLDGIMDRFGEDRISHGNALKRKR
jgi:hypothetical protein